MINPLQENVLPLRQLRRQLPGKPAYQTLLEWCTKGRKNRLTGRRETMEKLRLPPGYHSSLEAYLRFIDRLNSLD